MKKNQIEQKINNALIMAFSIPLEVIKSNSNERGLVDKRHIICYWMYQYTRVSTSKIGLIINRDHTTVIHGRKKIQNLIDSKNREIINDYQKFCYYMENVDYMPLVRYIADLPEKERNFVIENVQKMLSEAK